MQPYAERYTDSEHKRLYEVIQEDLVRLTVSDHPNDSDVPK